MYNTIFELKGVHFSYMNRFPALCGIDMNIKQGEKISIIGANGSGKSTLLHLLDGLIYPGKGIIKAFGVELNECALSNETFSQGFRRKVGLMFQNPDVQLFCPTVEEDIIFGPLQLGVERKEVFRRLDSISMDMGIKDLLERSPHQLSIGEKRKVAIASTLVIEPEVLLLDEPTAGLDPLTSRHIIDIILKANQDKKTVIISTHDLHIVEEISDTVYVLNQEKKIVKSGNPVEILQDSPLLQENNLVHIHSHSHRDTTHIHSHLHTEHHPT